jgi:hypothetical protein
MSLNKNICGLLIILLAFGSRSAAQAVDKEVIAKYNPSVVARVFGIIKHVKVEKEQQLMMAESIHAHDSTITRWMLNGMSQGSIDTLQQAAQFQVLGILTKDQQQTYRYNSQYEISNAIAATEAEYIRKEFNPDSLTLLDLRRSLANKYSYLLQNFSDNYLFNKEGAVASAKKLHELYDTYKYFPMFYSRKYIAQHTARIKAIRDVPEATLAAIEHSFYELIWKDKHTDWSLAARNATSLKLPDTALFSVLYRQEIQQEALEGLASERYYLIFREHVSQEAFDSVSKLVKEKFEKKVLIRQTYAAYHQHLHDWTLRETMKRYDSTIEARLVYDGSIQPTTQFAIALKYKQQLGLKPEQCDVLIKHAMHLWKQRDSIFFKDPFASIDFNEYETTYLTQILTEKQYNTVLFHKNRTYASANAAADWQEMVVRGLDRGFLKDEAITQMTDYFIAKNNAWCRYANDKVKLWANLRALEDTKPKALKVLDPVRWSGATEKAKNNLQLQW